MKISPTDKCLSVVINLSDNFRKSHHDIFKNLELNWKLRNKHQLRWEQRRQNFNF